MNNNLSPEEFEACLFVLERGLVDIRAAAYENDSRTAERISDALHNLPRLLMGEPGWTLDVFEHSFLSALPGLHAAFTERLRRT